MTDEKPVTVMTLIETHDPEAALRVIEVDRGSQRMFRKVMEGVCPSCDSEVEDFYLGLVADYDWSDSANPRWGMCNTCGWAKRFKGHTSTSSVAHVIMRVVADE